MIVSRLQKYGVHLLLALIVMAAAIPRFIDLEHVPVGADGDVAWYGMNALDWIDRGVWPYYIREQYGPEPLSSYAIGLAILFTGINNATARVATAVAGVLWVALLYPAVYWMLSDFPQKWRVRAGLLTALGAAFSLHAIFISRLGLPAPYLPTIITLLIWLTAWARAKGGYWRWGLAGAALALTEYIYIAGRVMPLAVVLWFLYVAVAQREVFRHEWRSWLVMSGAAVMLVLPNIITYVTQPRAFAARAEAATAFSGQLIWQLDTSRFGGPLGLVAQKLKDNFLAVGVSWPGPYTSGIGQPILTPLLFAGFLWSVFLLLRHPKQPAYAWMWLAIPVALIPDLISSQTPQPHAMRQIDVLPFVFILAGVGLTDLWRLVETRLKNAKAQMALGGVIAALIVIPFFPLFNQWFVVLTAQIYSQPDTGWKALETDLDISDQIISQPDKTYLIPYTEYERSSLAWGIAGVFRDRGSAIAADGTLQVKDLPDQITVMLPSDPRRVRWDGYPAQVDNRLWVLLQNGHVWFLPPLTADQTQTVMDVVKNSTSEPLVDWSGTTIAHFTPIPTPREVFAPRPVVDIPADATFAGQVQLVGYSVPSQDVTPGETFFATFYWKTLQPPSEDYEVFVQLWNDAGQVVSQWQNVAFGGMYRMRIWQPSELVASNHWLTLPKNLEPGRYHLIVGLFRTTADKRVEVTGANADSTLEVARVGDLRYPLPPASTPGTPPPSDIKVGSYFDLSGVHVKLDGAAQAVGSTWTAKGGQSITVETHWKTLATPPQDYNAFLHLIPVGGTQPTAQADALIEGSYPTGVWRTGDLTADQMTLTLPADLPAGTYQLWYGVYYWQTDQRLPVTENGVAQPDDRVLLGTITVG